MQSENNHGKDNQQSGLKQVKVDNWGTFFLQRLQQLYSEEQLLDLTIRFPANDITVQAHRLVVTTCTDYFMNLEREQRESNEFFDGILIMPSGMPYECVKSIISFMYTGQLEYWNSEQDALYRTAEKMNMTVLTKLLDAQSCTGNTPVESPSNANQNKSFPGTGKDNNRNKKSTSAEPMQVLPGRKLPIWKRKLDSLDSQVAHTNYDSGLLRASSVFQRTVETTPGPSRFDLPEVEDYTLGVFSSFDDITYNTKPIVQAPENSNNTNNNLNDSSMNGESSESRTQLQRNKPIREDHSDDDWTGLKSAVSKQDTEMTTPLKKVRFDFDEKENIDKSQCISTSSNNVTDSIDNHAKIIKEVLKKYPHLVKNSKNIRLKIMQKEGKSSKPSAAQKTKVSYVVLKSDHLMSDKESDENSSKPGNIDGGEIGPWKCNKCDLEEEYTNYYMYRRHMQDVHEEKFDPRICEHCGYKATKRNILMYHLYTKHNVPPPKNMSFPKCHVCSYVALSETLLVKHQINHNHRPNRSHDLSADQIQCMQCERKFKDVSELASHEIGTGHGTCDESKDRTHRCQYCGKNFVRLTNLRVHLDCAHKELRNSSPVTSVPAPLEPSTEAEALSNVASGIATSLGVDDELAESEQTVGNSTTGYCGEEMRAIDAHNYQDEALIMSVDGDSYQVEESREEDRVQHELSRNQGLIMQNSGNNMIVYIQQDDSQNDKYRTCNAVQVSDGNEEIVEEVVEEFEELEEEYEGVDDAEMAEGDTEVEEEIQYVEEETEIVEYNEDEENSRNNSSSESQEAIMIIEERLEDDGSIKENGRKRELGGKFVTNQWNIDNADV